MTPDGTRIYAAEGDYRVVPVLDATNLGGAGGVGVTAPGETVRYLLDGGPRVITLLAELRDDQQSSQWRPTWRPVPSAFLDRMVSEA